MPEETDELGYNCHMSRKDKGMLGDNAILVDKMKPLTMYFDSYRCERKNDLKNAEIFDDDFDEVEQKFVGRYPFTDPVCNPAIMGTYKSTSRTFSFDVSWCLTD